MTPYRMRDEVELERVMKYKKRSPSPRNSSPRNVESAPAATKDSEDSIEIEEELDHVLDDDKLMREPSLWRMKERMKTVSVALVLCLNIGTSFQITGLRLLKFWR